MKTIKNSINLWTFSNSKIASNYGKNMILKELELYLIKNFGDFRLKLQYCLA